MNRNTEGGRNKIFNRIAEEETMEISKIEEKKKKDVNFQDRAKPKTL